MNPNSSRPVSYDSLKTLLQYAKPNLRLELSRRIPSIRMTEKAVPLRIDKLMIGSHGIELNDTKYEANTIRQFPSDSIGSKVFLHHDYREDEWDLDEWGSDAFSSETFFTPGDLVLRPEGQLPKQRVQNEELKNEIERTLKYYRWMIAKKSGENVEAWTDGEVNIIFKNYCKSLSLTRLKFLAEKFTIRLAPYNYVENNAPLPFTRMFQVAIRSENGDMCWRYSGNLKHYEIKKQLMTWLLGNRKHVIHVNHFIVNNGIIARLPEDLRISVKMLQIQTFSSPRISVDINTILNKLEPIIHNNNRPLEVFETEKISENFDHPLATTAKKLVANQCWYDFPNANRLIRIPNQKMHMFCSLKRPGYFEPGKIIRMIRDWIENPREIGKCFSFDGLEERVMNFMQRIQTTFEGIRTERSIKIPVNNSSQISVSYESEGFRKWSCYQLRLMTIEVGAV